MAMQVMDEPLTASNGLFGHLHLRAVLTDEQEAALVEQARFGDVEARHELVMNALRLMVFRVRERLGRGVHQWRIEFEDVMQHAYLNLWERLEELLAAPKPGAWMVEQVRYAVEDYVHYAKSLLRLPDGASFLIPPVQSLDVPIDGDDSGVLLADCLEAAPLEPSSGSSEAYEPLYQAIRALSPRQRYEMVTFYHLELECGLVEEEARKTTKPNNTRCYARKRLREVLAEAYPQYAGEYQPVRVRPGYADAVISQDQLQRLQAAHQEMLALGERVTWRALGRKVQMGGAVVGAYLYRVRQGQVA